MTLTVGAVTPCGPAGGAYGAGTFICSNDSGLFGSSDGKTWTQRATVTGTYRPVFGKGRFVVGASTGSYGSADGVTFSQVSTAVALGFTVTDGTFFGFAQQSEGLLVSSDGVTFQDYLVQPEALFLFIVGNKKTALLRATD